MKVPGPKTLARAGCIVQPCLPCGEFPQAKGQAMLNGALAAGGPAAAGKHPQRL